MRSNAALFSVNPNPKLSLSIKQKDGQGKAWPQRSQEFYFSNKSRNPTLLEPRGSCWSIQLREYQALPLILAHHQRTPTNRNRQSWKNSGGFPSKA